MRIAETHNLLTGRPDKQVMENVEKILAKGALVVAFQEAATYHAIIKSYARAYGYTVIYYKGRGRGMSSSVLLVKHGAALVSFGVMKIWRPWIGPRMGILWPGRTVPWAIVLINGKHVLFTSDHAPTGRNGNPLNRIAFRKFLKRHRKLYKKKLRIYRDLQFFFMGDWNCPASAKDARSVQRLLVDKLDAKVADPNGKPPIDYGVHNLNKTVVAEDGPRYGSDHDSASFTLAA